MSSRPNRRGGTHARTHDRGVHEKAAGAARCAAKRWIVGEEDNLTAADAFLRDICGVGDAVGCFRPEQAAHSQTKFITGGSEEPAGFWLFFFVTLVALVIFLVVFDGLFGVFFRRQSGCRLVTRIFSAP